MMVMDFQTPLISQNKVKKKREEFNYRAFLIKERIYKNPHQISICIGISQRNYYRSNKVENIYPSYYSKIMRPAYRHILNTDLINRTFAILFFKRRGHLNEIAEWRMKDSRTKNEEAYYDKLDSRRNCCLAGGYLTLYRATVALL